MLICIWARCQPSSEVRVEGGGELRVAPPLPQQGGKKSPRPLLHLVKGPPVLCYLRPHFRLPGSPSSGLTSVTPAVGGSPFLHLALLQPRELMSHTLFPLLRCHMTGWGGGARLKAQLIFLRSAENFLPQARWGHLFCCRSCLDSSHKGCQAAEWYMWFLSHAEPLKLLSGLSQQQGLFQ